MSEDRAVGTYRIGRVLSKTLKVFFGNIIAFTILALIVMSPQHILTYFTVQGSADGMAAPQISDTHLIMMLLGVLLSLILGGLLSAAVTYGTYQNLGNRRVSIGDCIGNGLKLLPLVIGISVLFGLMLSMGMLLLVIPGIIVLVMFLVCVPVAVVERPGVFASFRRSRELTKGLRWRVLGSYLVGMVIMVGLSMVIGLVSVLLAAALGGEFSTLAAVLVEYVINSIAYAFLAVLVAVIYHELRVAKEGASVDEIAAVFD